MPLYNPSYDAMSVDNRIIRAVKELTDAGMSKPEAQSIVAISITESSVIWGKPRASTPTMPSLECWPGRQVVGWEFDWNPNGGSSNWRSALGADAEAAKKAVELGLAVLNNEGKYVAGPKMKTDGQPFVEFFEWVVYNRKGAQLVHFSIGPTQKHMYWTPMAGHGGNPHWPQTWEALWDYYTATEMPQLMSGLHYLDAPMYPAESPGNASLGVVWISKQTGGGYAQKYYDNAYRGNLTRVLSLTK